MLNKNTWCVILAGGKGKRFWPVSTQDFPKQFLQVPDLDESFLQHTVRRFEEILPLERILVVTTRGYAPLVREQLPSLSEANILKEPYAKDTANSVALAMFTILKRDPAGMMIVVPADHLIREEDKFRSVVCRMAEELRDYDVLATIGVWPSRPDTNYGYIQTEDVPVEGSPVKVKTFTEKPDKEMAEAFFNSGDFLWNSGVFIWKAETILKEFQRFMPQIVSVFNGWEGALDTKAEPDFLDRVFTDLPKISIDYAIMERTDKAWTMPADFGWYDLGTFESLYSSHIYKDADGNCPSWLNLMTVSSHNDLVICRDRKKLVAISGLDNYVVVDTDKVLFICPRTDKAVRDLTSNLTAKGFDEYK